MDFAFNASALGAGGVIERGPVTYTIPSLASVALAPTGGEGRSVMSNYYSEELAFSHAETRVFGRMTRGGDDPQFTTSTYVLLKDVSIFGRIKIGEMSSTVTSTRGYENDDDHPFDVSVSYDRVTIDGRPVRPLIDTRLAGLTRYADLRRLLDGRKAYGSEAKGLADSFNTTPDELETYLRDRKPVQTSMIDAIEGLEAWPEPRTYHVPGLGTVRFAELMLKPGRRRLNLVRMRFGRQHHRSGGPQPQAMMMAEGPFDENTLTGPTGGSMTVGSGEGNGTPIGP